MYEAGSTLQAVATALGWSMDKVRSSLRAQGVAIRPPGKPARAWPISLEEAYRRYIAGQTPEEIGKIVGLNGFSVWKRFRDEGLPLRTKMEAIRLTRRHTRLDEALLRRTYESGLSIEETAKRLGSTRKIVATNLQRYGIPRRNRASLPTRNGSWKGGYSIDKDGYILVRRPEHPNADKGGYVRAHRLVMQNKLGRPLAPDEVVDHKDGDTSNNDPSNLRLFATNGEHLQATRTGRERLTAAQRELQRQLDVQRARHRVAATLAALEADAHWSHVAWPRPSTAPRTAEQCPSDRAPHLNERE